MGRPYGFKTRCPRSPASVPGQSLLEALLAIGIIASSVASSITVVSGAIGAEKDSESNVIAAGLGREGIEVVRELRDSNWLAQRPWDQGIAGDNTDYVGTPFFDPATGTWTMSYVAATLDDDVARVYRYSTGSGSAVVGLQVQADSQPADTAVSPFRRVVEVNPICSDGAIVTSGSDCGPLDKTGIQAVARVRWRSSGRLRNLVIEERMYDWR